MARLANLCGALEENLRQIETALEVDIVRRGEHFSISGRIAQTKLAAELLERFYSISHRPIEVEEVQLSLIELRMPEDGLPAAPGEDGMPVLKTKRADLRGRTPRQNIYLEADSRSTTSPSALAPPVPARPIWPWPAPWMRLSAMWSSAWCWCVRRLKRVSAWAFCPVTWSRRSTLSAPACTTRCMT